MDDLGIDDQSVDDFSYDASYQACYIFRSGRKGEDGSLDRPSKKRKLNGVAARELATTQRPGLSLATRKRLFESSWPPEQALDDRADVDETTLIRLVNEIQTESPRSDSRLNTALIVSGVDEANYQNVVRGLDDRFRHAETADGSSVQAQIASSTRSILVELRPQQCTNLQVTLKNLVKLAIVKATDLETYQEFLVARKKLLPLAFDLDLLDDFCRQRKQLRIVVSLADIESFSNQVLNELIATLNLWKDRVWLFLLCGIASTRELFEQRLSRSCLRLLNARQYVFVPSINSQSNVLRSLQRPAETISNISFENTTLLALYSISRSQGNSQQSLEQMLKLLYVTYNLTNPLSGLFHDAGLDSDEIHIVAEAVRRTESFRDYCVSLLHRNGKLGGEQVKALLENDQELLDEVKAQVEHGQKRYKQILEVVYFIADIADLLDDDKPNLKRSRADVEAILLRSLPNLLECEVYSDVRDRLQALQPAQILSLLDRISLNTRIDSISHNHCIKITGNDDIDEASNPKTKRANTKKRSRALLEEAQTEDQHPSKRTLDKASFLKFLEKLVSDHAIDISELLLHESFIIPNRSLRLKQSFEPNPRVVIERALTSPGDYLGCACCNTSAGQNDDEQSSTDNGDRNGTTSNGSMPPSATLFILLQEAPTIINLRDLYDAFESRIQASQAVSPRPDESTSNTIMMLFYKALAELKMMGLVKESAGTQIKRKTKGNKAGTQDADFVAKTSWGGL